MILRRNHPRKQSSKKKISDIIFSSSPRKVSRKSRNSIKSQKISYDYLKKGTNLSTKQQKPKQDVLQGKKELKLMIKPINIDDLHMKTSNKDSRKHSSSEPIKMKNFCKSSNESRVNNLKLSGKIVTESVKQVPLLKNASFNNKKRGSTLSHKQLNDLIIPTLSLNEREEIIPEFTRKTRSLSRKSNGEIEVNKSVLQKKSKKTGSNESLVNNLKLSGEMGTKSQKQVPLLKNASFNSKERESPISHKQLDDLTINEAEKTFPEFTRKTRSLSRMSNGKIGVNKSVHQKKSKKSREQSNRKIDDLDLLSLTLNKGGTENSPVFVRKTRSSSRMSDALTDVNKSVHQQLSRNSSTNKSSKKTNIVVKHSGNQLKAIQNEVQPQENASIYSKAIKVPFFYQKLIDLNISDKENIPVFDPITRSLIRKVGISTEIKKSITQKAKTKSDNASTKNSKENKTAKNKNHKKIVGNSEGRLNEKITEVAEQISEEVSMPDSTCHRSLRVRRHTVEPIKEDSVKNILKTKKPPKRYTIEVDKKTITDDKNKSKDLQTKKSFDSNKKTAKNNLKIKNLRGKQAVESVTKKVTNKVSKTKSKRRQTTKSGSRTPKQKKILSKSDNFTSPIPERSYLNGIPLDDLHLTLFRSPSSPFGGKNPVSSTPIVNSRKIKNKAKPFEKLSLNGNLGSKIPSKGSLKRKRWLMNTLKEKNEGYEDDLFENKNFGQFKFEDSDVSMFSIATPKCAFLVTPNVCSKSPRFKDCYSPSELLKARKVAEEVMHMRNKKRKSESGLNPSYCENLTSKLNSTRTSAGELPEKKKLEYLEMIQSIPKASDAVEEDDESDKDDYFSDESS